MRGRREENSYFRKIDPEYRARMKVNGTASNIIRTVKNTDKSQNNTD
jgi:hypothetical protein